MWLVNVLAMCGHRGKKESGALEDERFRNRKL